MIDGYFSIDLSQKEVKLASEFAGRVVKTDVYGFRNGQTNVSRRFEQQLGGKLAEIAIYQHFKEKNIELSYPDLTIKERKDKNWEPDLKIISSNIVLHVKSQDQKSLEKYSLSWIGERTDKELYLKNTGYVLLCSVDVEKRNVKIFGSPKTSFLQENNLFQEPVLRKHQGKKFAIYYDSLKKFEKEDIWRLHFDLNAFN